MLAFGRFNDHFGARKSYFSKSYVDYSLKEIKNENNGKLPDKEEKIITNAKLKYYSIILVNFSIFIFSIRRIYKKGLIELYTKEDTKIKDRFLFTAVISTGLMIYLYQLSNRIYYNDLKYLIKKYKNIDSEKYKDAELSRKIVEFNKNKLNE